MLVRTLVAVTVSNRLTRATLKAPRKVLTHEQTVVGHYP